MEISLNSTIHKYTNLLFGYQERYFKISNGAIYYYLSRESEAEGCRGFRTLTSKNFKLQLDSGDPCKLELIFSDGEAWNLRFRNTGEMVVWHNALQAFLITDSTGIPTSKNSMQGANTSSSSRSSLAYECVTLRRKSHATEMQEAPTEAEINQLLESIGDGWRDLKVLLRSDSGVDGERIKAALRRVRQMEGETHSLKVALKRMVRSVGGGE